jgi:Mg2+ and Co2+ transporter CorA
MIKKYTHKSITWIDAENPTNEEVRALEAEYNINPDIAADLHLPTTTNYKEKVVMNKDYMYMVMHFPALRHSHTDDINQEIDFIVGKDFIITTRYETIDALERFAKMFEVNSTLGKHIMEDNAGYVLYYILKELYVSIANELDSINDTLKITEKNIFKGNEKKMVTDISLVNRDLINLNHVILSHKDILEHVQDISEKLFDKEFSGHFQSILDEYRRIQNVLMNDIDFLKELRNTNDSLLSSKQGDTMKILTIITFLALPFSVITGFFSMNTKYTPLADTKNGWEIILGIAFFVSVLFFLFAKKKKWL